MPHQVTAGAVVGPVGAGAVCQTDLVALIYVGGTEAVAPMTVTLANLTNSLGQGYNLLTAAAFLSMIVPLIVFLSLQRYFVRGILAGSVKG